MSDAFACNWVEFKLRAKQFFDAAPTLDVDQLDNMFKALSLSYLNMEEDMWRSSAASVMHMASKTLMHRTEELS